MLIVSIFIICLAHIIRVYRWELFIETYEEPNGVRLTRSLSLGYFLNYFIPFKAGDLFRALYAGSGMQNGRGFAFASVIVERCLDIISVGIIFAVLELGGINSSNRQAAAGTMYYAYIALGLVIALFIAYRLRKYIKRVVFLLCGMLNEKYEEKLLRFFWALIWGFKDIISRLPKARLLFYTFLMWGLYLSSYGAFSALIESAGINRSFSSIFYSLFDQKSLFASGMSKGFSFSTETVFFAIFLLVPPVVLWLGSFILERLFGVTMANRRENLPIVEENSSMRAYESAQRLNLIPQTNPDERRTFLRMYFAGEKKDYIENYLNINRNILVLKDYSAGSNATTILCTDGEKSFYRKYAFQEASKKLAGQITWMETHESSLPIAEITKKDVKDDVSFYDMPYYSDAVTLFEYAQSGDKEKVWGVIENLLTVLEKKLYRSKKKAVSQENGDSLDSSIEALVDKYIDEKVTKNLRKILEDKSLSGFLKYDKLIINGKEYNNITSYLDKLLKEYLKGIFAKDRISDVHGDLTIENIICMKNELEDGQLDFYLIDPNPGNILDTKYIDYAKLLQSLHGKYEYLMAVDEVSVSGNRIDYKFFETETYSYLYEKYREYLTKKFKKSDLKSIYYHEIVNWLRLMPYKLEKGVGIQFFAGMIIVMNDIFEVLS